MLGEDFKDEVCKREGKDRVQWRQRGGREIMTKGEEGRRRSRKI